MNKQLIEEQINNLGFKILTDYSYLKDKVQTICVCGKIFNPVLRDLLRTDSKRVRSCGHCTDPKIGDKIYNLTITNVIAGKTHGCNVSCICNCGNIISCIKFTKIRNGYVQSCGKCPTIKIGDRFGKLVVNDIKYSSVGHGCRVSAKCDCGGIWTGKGNTLLIDRVQSCGCVVSRGENKIIDVLKKYNVTFERQKRFANCKDKRPLPFDFYLPEYNLAIEYQGQQHYHSAFFGESAFNTTVLHDGIKLVFCQHSNIKLITIKYTEFDSIENILKLELGLQEKDHEPIC